MALGHLSRNAECTCARAHEGHRIAHDGPPDPRQRGKVEKLVIGGEIFVGGKFGKWRAVDDVIVGHCNVFEMRRAAAGQALAKTIPVIDAGHAGRIGRYDKLDAVGAIGCDRDNPRRIKRAGGIIFRAIQPPLSLRIGRKGGGGAGTVRQFSHGGAEQGALCNLFQPVCGARAVAFMQTPFDKGEMGAEDLRQV